MVISYVPKSHDFDYLRIDLFFPCIRSRSRETSDAVTSYVPKSHDFDYLRIDMCIRSRSRETSDAVTSYVPKSHDFDYGRIDLFFEPCPRIHRYFVRSWRSDSSSGFAVAVASINPSESSLVRSCQRSQQNVRICGFLTYKRN